MQGYEGLSSWFEPAWFLLRGSTQQHTRAFPLHMQPWLALGLFGPKQRKLPGRAELGPKPQLSLAASVLQVFGCLGCGSRQSRLAPRLFPENFAGNRPRKESTEGLLTDARDHDDGVLPSTQRKNQEHP